MGSRREDRDFRISAIPWRPGLITAGQATSIPELDLRKCINADGAIDGMIRSRPGREQWGQRLKAPDTDTTGSTLTALSDFIVGTGGYTTTDASSGKVTTETDFGLLKTTVEAGSSNEKLTLSYDAKLSTNTTWSFRFTVRCTNFQDYGGGTTPNTLAIRAQGSSGSGKEFAIWAGGLYYKKNLDNAYALITDSDYIGNGAWNTVEIRCDSTGNTLVYINDGLVDTLTSSDLATASFEETNSAYEFVWEVEGSGTAGTQYSTYITTPMYNDVDEDPFEDQEVTALSEFQYLTSSNTRVRSWLVAAGDYIYHDKNLEGAWRPLKRKQFRHVYFAPYRTKIAWSDNNGASSATVWLWDGSSDPERQDTAPPVRYLVEHQQRLCGWGDVRFPRRWYYSGDRRPNVWYSPSEDNAEDQFEEILDAGYVEIPSQGVEIRASWGDFYGTAVIIAERGYWLLTGSGVFSYRLDGLKVSTGAANAGSITQVGNDLWVGGGQGITSLLTVQKFGDIESARPSIPIQNLWNPGESTETSINQTYIGAMQMAYSANQATVYFAVPHINNQRAVQMYQYNTNTQKFYGPEEVDATALAVGELASPVTEVVMMGGEDGRVSYLNPFLHRDYRSDSGQYTMKIRTAALNGRSIDPGYIGYEKTFHTLRLYLLPRMDQDFTVTWWPDTEPFDDTNDFRQNPGIDRQYFSISKDFRLDINRIQSGNELTVQEVPIDERGRDLTVQIESDYNFAIQGWELEGTIHGYESDE